MRKIFQIAFLALLSAEIYRAQIVDGPWIIFLRTFFDQGSTVSIELSNQAVYLFSHNDASLLDYTAPVDTTVFIEAADNYKILVQFRKPVFEMTTQPELKADFEAQNIDCDSYNAYLEIFDGSSILAPRLAIFCGTDFPIPYQLYSSGGFVTMRAFLPGFTSSGDFRMDVSNWNDPGNCTDEDMRCDDGSCIPKVLLCDEFNIGHCPDDTDTREEIRIYCDSDPPVDLFGMGWFWNLSIIYFFILSSIIWWLCCIRPGVFWYLMGCIRRMDYWPEICHYGCPCYIHICSRRDEMPPNQTSMFRKVETEEVIYEDNSAAIDMSSNRRSKFSKRRGGANAGGANTSTFVAVMPPPPTTKKHSLPPAYAEVAGYGGGSARDTLNVDDGNKKKKSSSGKKEQQVVSNVMPGIPANVCLHEEWNMHMRENRF